MNTYDVIVIGGGPGGYVCAIRAAQLGRKTALIERDLVGGTCLNRGCIPTKVLLHSAEVYHTVLHAGEYGVGAGPATFDYSAFAARKDKITARLRGGVEALLKKAGVETISGTARLKNPGTVAVNGSLLSAGSIVLATGSRPILPPIPGADQDFVGTSDQVLELRECPKSVVVVGGGVIGLEFATLYSTLGSKVTVLEMMPTILTGMDGDVVKTMNRVLKKSGIEVHTGAKVLSIGDREVSYEEKGQTSTAAGEYVLLATGRRPCTEGLGLEDLEVRLDQKGFVQVDDTMKTNLPGLYAIGDITGKVQLAHVASEQGLVAAHNAAGQPRGMNYDVIPACVYTSPEIASVGLTEEAAKERGIPVKIGSFPVAANGKSMIVGEANGFSKLVTHAGTGEILGAHIVAPRATDLIAEICAAMRGEATVDELCHTIHPHPTISEMVMEAAHDVHGLCIHKP